MIVRELHGLGELARCTALEAEVWGVGPRELTPVAVLVAWADAGGLVSGAFGKDDPEGLLGFTAAFPSFVAGEPGLHSHQAAVRADLRDRGIGLALKRFQRTWALERGLRIIRWTCDPLQGRNLHLNLDRLGALGVAYLPDHYGTIGGDLNGDLPSDRLLVEWRLDSARAARAAAGEAVGGDEPEAWAVRAGADGLPQAGEDAGPQDDVRVALPASLDVLLARAPEAALAWRLAVREALAPRLAAGAAVKLADRAGLVVGVLPTGQT